MLAGFEQLSWSSKTSVASLRAPLPEEIVQCENHVRGVRVRSKEVAEGSYESRYIQGFWTWINDDQARMAIEERVVWAEVILVLSDEDALALDRVTDDRSVGRSGAKCRSDRFDIVADPNEFVAKPVIAGVLIEK